MKILSKLIFYLIFIYLICFIACSESKDSEDTIILSNKNIKDIYIVNNDLFYCEQRKNSSYKIVDYTTKTIVYDSIKRIPDVIAKDEEYFLYGYQDEANVRIWKRDVETIFEGQIIWEGNSKFLITDYEFVEGNYLGKLRSFPTNQITSFQEYAITNRYNSAKVLVKYNDTTSILTPGLKLLSKTKNNFFTDYKGDYFPISQGNCMLRINNIEIKVCFDEIVSILHYKNSFYIFYKYNDSLYLINENGDLIGDLEINSENRYAIIYNNSKLQIGFFTKSSKYLYSKLGKTQIVAQFLMDNGEFYSIKENHGELFLVNENNEEDIYLGNDSDYQYSVLLFDYFSIEMTSGTIIIDKSLNKRGIFTGQVQTYKKSDNNLFILTSEGKVYRF